MTLEKASLAAPGQGSPSVEAAFRILDVLAEAGVPLGMADIARGAALPKSSAFRLLRSLEVAGVVRRGAGDKLYSLSGKLRRYATSTPAPELVDRFLDVAKPLIRQLNETTQFGVLTGADVTFLACIESTRPVRLVSYAGRTLPAHASATGKAILAFETDGVVEAVIEAGLPALTPRTITDPDAFRAELRRVRQRGYATESAESVADLSCVAVPVWRADSRPAGAVTICLPRAVLPGRQVTSLREVASTISSRMSHAAPSN